MLQTGKLAQKTFVQEEVDRYDLDEIYKTLSSHVVLMSVPEPKSRQFVLKVREELIDARIRAWSCRAVRA